MELAVSNADRVIPSAPHCQGAKEIYLLVDPRKCDDAKAIVGSARRIVALFLHQNSDEQSRDLSNNHELEIYVSVSTALLPIGLEGAYMRSIDTGNRAGYPRVPRAREDRSHDQSNTDLEFGPCAGVFYLGGCKLCYYQCRKGKSEYTVELLRLTHRNRLRS